MIINCLIIGYLFLYAVFKVRKEDHKENLYHLHGDGEIRTLDPLLARQVLSQLSYTPVVQSALAAVPPLSAVSFL